MHINLERVLTFLLKMARVLLNFLVAVVGNADNVKVRYSQRYLPTVTLVGRNEIEQKLLD